MTEPIVRLETPRLTVEPGGQASTTVTVRNLGTIVEGYKLHVVGEGASDWAQVSPDEVQVYPDQEATAVVVFTPPAGTATRSGSFPFGLRAESVVDPGNAAVAEGDLEIGRVFGLQAKLTPVTSSGRWRAKHFVALTNWGNAPVRLKVSATDPDEKLAFLVGPEFIDLPLGVTGHTQVRVKTKSPFLRGTPVRLPFQLVAEPDPPEEQVGPPSPIPNPRRATMDGAFTQKPILSKLTVVAALIGVLAIGGGVAYALTRPSAESNLALTSGLPPTPQLSAVAKDATSIQLLWQPQPNIDTYSIRVLDADGNTVDAPSVEGVLTSHLVTDLAPQTTMCFQMQAMRGDQSSPLSDQQCATTPAAAATGESPTSGSGESSPAASSAPESTGPATSGGEAPTSGGEAPTTDGQPPTTGGAVPNNGGVPVGPTQGGTAAPSGGTAAQTTGGQPTGGGQPTDAPATVPPGFFQPSQRIAVVFTVPAAGELAPERAELKRQELIDAGLQVRVLRTTDYPGIRLASGTPIRGDSYVVYAGPFDNQQAVAAFCQANAAKVTLCYDTIPSP